MRELVICWCLAFTTVARTDDTHERTHARTHCNIVQPIEFPGLSAALVRATWSHFDGNQLGGFLDPICPQCMSPPDSVHETTPCGLGSTLEVPHNTRSYLLSQDHNSSSCANHKLGVSFPEVVDSYRCVDYRKDAMFLAGRTLLFDVDLSGASCGCNAAVYLVAMPQSTDKTICGDHYCDANPVCGVACAEIDLMEANRVAWSSNVHAADDGNGEGFGISHYTIEANHRFAASDGRECAYGPSATCAIDTRRRFTARFRFGASATAAAESSQAESSQAESNQAESQDRAELRKAAAFGFDLSLEQEGRTAHVPVQGSHPTLPPHLSTNLTCCCLHLHRT